MATAMAQVTDGHEHKVSGSHGHGDRHQDHAHGSSTAEQSACDHDSGGAAGDSTLQGDGHPDHDRVDSVSGHHSGHGHAHTDVSGSGHRGELALAPRSSLLGRYFPFRDA
jgi:hypothetical protein